MRRLFANARSSLRSCVPNADERSIERGVLLKDQIVSKDQNKACSNPMDLFKPAPRSMTRESHRISCDAPLVGQPNLNNTPYPPRG